MAGKKTPDSPSNDDQKADETRQDAETVPASESSAAAGENARTMAPAGTDDEPETVDAEVVEDGKTFESGSAGTTTDAPPPDDERTAANRTDAKKGAGIGFGAVLAVLLLVGAVLIYFVATSGDEAELADTAPGVVRGEAEPFPPNELSGESAPDEGPIEGQAAPGAREAAMAADEGERADTDEETLRAEAAERAQARREAREADMANAETAEAGADDAAADAQGDASPAEMDMAARLAAARAAQQGQDEPQESPAAAADTAEDAETAEAIGMAERLAAARAAQTREDAEAGAVTAEGAETPAQAGTEEEMAAPEEDDPNALTGFLRPEQEDEALQTEEPVSEPEETATARETEGASVTRPTGQIEREEEGEAQAMTPLRRPRGEASAEGETVPAAEEAPEPAPAPAERQEAEAEEIEAAPETETVQETETSEIGAPAAPAADRPQRIEPRPARVQTGPDLDEELDQRLDAVRADVRQDVLAEAEQRIEAAIRETEAEVRRLRAELTEQEARSNARIAQLQDRLEVLQSRNAAETQQGVLILALSSLGSEVDQGRPFTRQIEDIGRLAPNVRSLDFARGYAATGLPTDEELRDDFQAAAREAQSAARREGAEGFGKLWANLTGLFTVRPAGPVEGDTPSAVISRAEAALETGDLAGAVNELRSLEGEAREAFEPWMEIASAKAQIRERIDALERAVLARAG